MNLFVYNQLVIFGWAILFGFVLCFFYDILRAIRRVIPHHKTAVGIEDLVFWLISGFGIFYYIFYSNNGAIRAFIFIGIIIGGVLYLMILSSWILCFMTKIFGFIFAGFIKPFLLLLKQFKKLFKFIHKGLKKSKKWLIIRTKRFLKQVHTIIKKV